MDCKIERKKEGEDKIISTSIPGKEEEAHKKSKDLGPITEEPKWEWKEDSS